MASDSSKACRTAAAFSRFIRATMSVRAITPSLRREIIDELIVREIDKAEVKVTLDIRRGRTEVATALDIRLRTTSLIT
ncbi:hypothetical protein GCM10023196_040250 [Actinoallomurus vinaceus]|uniref:Uncharacterized protein n=1 Tax=Actinoallomurus vinaceus TaxID=1080074 RepID=A0ABP8UCW8_9ACTN